MKEVYKPRSVIVDSVELTNFDGSQTIDLSNIFVDLNVYEDMFHSQITGDITIEDTLELVECLPIIGEEYLTIKWHVPTTDIDDHFNTGRLRVYKVGDRAASGAKAGRGSSYTLYFVSEEAIVNLNNAISRSFNTKTASEIASIIYRDYINSDKVFDVEETEGKLKLIIPRWNPFKSLNWLANTKAVNKKYDADFFFYESLNGSTGPKFNFRSLSSLFEQDPSFSIEFQVQNISDGNGHKNSSTASYNIESFQFSKNADVIDNMANGMYTQTWILHDPLRKKFVISKPNYLNDFYDKDGGKMMYSNKLDASMNPLQCVRMPGGINSFPASISPSKSLDNDTTKGFEASTHRKSISYIASRESTDELECTSLISDFGAKRAFKMQLLNNYKVVFPSIPGTHKIHLGSIVTFNKPHIAHDNDLYNKKLGRFDDRFVSGKYLVMRMRHNISISSTMSERSYTISLEGVKNSFVEEISNKKV